MIGNKIAFILIFFFSMTLVCFGQKIKYRDYKDDISLKNYRETIKNPKYSPIAAGLFNYVFPPAGYFYVGEPIRGACVLGSELVTSSVFVYGLVMSMSIDTETGQSPEGARAIMLSGMIATGIIQIWCIFDVVKIAKIKNLANQNNKVTIKLNPDLNLISKDYNNNSAVYGLRLSFVF